MSNETLDLSQVWSGRNSSQHTQRAYYRWIDRFLVDAAGLSATRGKARLQRMSQLPLPQISPVLLPDKFEAWLASLAEGGHSRQGLDQARAALVCLSELLAEKSHISAEDLAKLKAVSAPSLALNKAQKTILTPRQLSSLIRSAASGDASPNQRRRNSVVVMMLCMMALRREELAAAQWGDIQAHNRRIFLNIRKGSVEIPRSLLNALTGWRQAIGSPDSETPLVRRIWRGDRIASKPLSPDGISLIVRQAASAADLGAVSPDDLRRSLAASLRDAGYSTRDISKLLRHKNRRITARYLRRLQPPPHS